MLCPETVWTQRGYCFRFSQSITLFAMRVLYHLWLSPFCRKVRIALHEKNIDFELKTENYWQRREAFLVLNPAGDVPVLVE